MTAREDLSPLTAAKLRELLSYDRESGALRWRKRSNARSRIQIGALAGSIKGGGYREVEIDGIIYQAHRLAWLHVTGAWPAAEIDHRDLNRANNAWGNLRAATQAQNHANKRPYSATGFKGVVQAGNRFQARIMSGGRNLFLGSFQTANEAAAAYRGAAKIVYGEFARTK